MGHVRKQREKSGLFLLEIGQVVTHILLSKIPSGVGDVTEVLVFVQLSTQ
jgi:predicted N-acetyltransferase YhbS